MCAFEHVCALISQIRYLLASASRKHNKDYLGFEFCVCHTQAVTSSIYIGVLYRMSSLNLS